MLPSAILLPFIIRVQDKSLLFTPKFAGLVPVVWLSCKHMLVFPIALEAMHSYMSAGLDTLQSGRRSCPSKLWRTGDDFGLKSWQAVTSLKIYLFCLLQLHSFMKPQWYLEDELHAFAFTYNKKKWKTFRGKKNKNTFFLLFFHFVATGKVVLLQSPLKEVCYHLENIFQILFLKFHQFQNLTCPVSG